MQDHQEQRTMFKEKTPLFYRIILDQHLHEGKLALPTRFVRKYGSDLPSSVLLKVPTGAVWPVELSKCNDDIWLAKGWPDFAKYYSLAHGHFLVFGYENGFGFHVLILNMGASEIQYPCCPSNEGLEELHVKNEVRKKGIEIMEEDVVCFGQDDMVRKAKSNCHQHQFEDIEYNGMSVLEDKQNRGIGSMAKIEPLIDALHKASPAFRPKNPHFVVAVYPTYVSTDVLAIPESFASKYFVKAHGSVILCSPDGKIWPLEFSLQRCQGRSFGRIYRGWKKFVQQYHLKVGDVCVFELVDAAELTLKVLFFRGSPNTDCPFSIVGKAVSDENHHARRVATKIMTSTDNEKCDAAKRAVAAFRSDNPFFVVTIKPSYVRNYVVIPASFARKYLKEQRGNVVLGTADGRTWLAKYLNLPCKRYAITHVYGGWNKFAQDNLLEVGDVCVFELVDSLELSLKVVIFRAAE